MKKLRLLIFIMIVLPNIGLSADKRLSVKAGFGMYGYGSWNMTIEEYGEVDGASFSYKANDLRAKVDAISKTGKIGKPVIINTTLSKEKISLIESAINSEGFSSIENSLRGEGRMLDGPSYSLQICLDEECHSVSLGYPPLVPKHLIGDFEKFKTVWNLLWSFVKRPEFDRPHVRL